MDFNVLKEIQSESLILRQVNEQDRQFISGLFNDPDTRKFYIVPKVAQQDYRQLISYWLDDMSKGAGYAWIIYKKGTAIPYSDEPCGFFAFEFQGSLTNARISYALAHNYRQQGITTKTAKTVIDKLKELGVQTIEADIDKDNTNSEKLIQRLGFTTDKRSALIDPEMMREGDVRIRFLWKKELFDYSQLDFYVVKEIDYAKLFAPGCNFKVWEEEASDGPAFSFMSFNTKPTGRYHFLFQGNVTEALVGISSDKIRTYNVPWELDREEICGIKRFMVFTGWGDSNSGGNGQFEGHEIGVESNVVKNMALNLKRINPIQFSAEILNKVIGFENLQF